MAFPEEEYSTEDPKGVIGAGFSRTGTVSVMIALEKILGIGPCLHMSKIHTLPVFERLATMRKFMELGSLANRPEAKARRQELLREVTKHYRSFLDFPISLYFEDLMEMYPNKKVLLTVRTNPAEWLKSQRETIMLFRDASWRDNFGYWAYAHLHPRAWIMSRFRRQSWEYHFGDLSDETMLRAYNEWIEHVKSVVPPERLIIMNVKEGWSPLINGLGITEIPKQPFPKVNESAELQELFYNMAPVGIATVTVYSLLVPLAGYGVTKLWRALISRAISAPEL